MAQLLLERLKEIVTRGDMTRAGLARVAGLHANSLRKLGDADWNPTAETLLKLEAFLDGGGEDVMVGPERIVDTPISESMIMAAAIGSALLGMRPVAELRYADFALCAADEIINQAAKARYMLGGQVRVPVVIRQPIARPVSDITVTVRTLRQTSLAVRPSRTAERDIGSDRKRSMMPFCMSSAMPAPVNVAPNTTVWAKIPAIRNSR